MTPPPNVCSRRRIVCSLLTILFTLVAAQLHAQQQWYVSPSGNDTTGTGTITRPFKTLTRARDVIRPQLAGMNTDFIINLRAGTYELSAPFVLGASDSGRNGHSVIFRPYRSEVVRISGGSVVTGWAAQPGGIFRASVGTQNFRQLYVRSGSTKLAIRAREPNTNSYYRLVTRKSSPYRIVVNTADLASVNNLSSADRNRVEMVVKKHFKTSRLRVATVTTSGGTADVAFLQPESSADSSASQPGKADGQTYYWENALSFLDQANEWFLDRAAGQLYFKPPGGSMSGITVIAPRLERLVTVDGANNVAFLRLIFEHTTWLHPENNGYVGQISGRTIAGTATLFGTAINVINATGFRFEGNVVVGCGAQGLTLQKEVSNAFLRGNRFEEISATGISVGNFLGTPTSSQVVSNSTVSFNYINRCALEYTGQPGITSRHSTGVTIANNDIRNLPYTGIAMVFGGNNTVYRNYIRNVMTLHDDGAALYQGNTTTGPNVFSENFVHNVERSIWAENFAVAGIYMDNSTTNNTFTNNVIRLESVDEAIHSNGNVDDTANTVLSNKLTSTTIEANAGLRSPYTSLNPNPGKPSAPSFNVQRLFLAGWAFEGNFNDSSGRGNTGRGSGLTFSTDARKGLQSVLFNSSSARFTYPAVTITDNPLRDDFIERSITLWVKATSTSGKQTILEDSDAEDGLAIRINAGKVEAFAKMYSNAPSPAVSGNFPTNGGWHHLALVFNRGILRLYLNGNLLAQGETAYGHVRAQILGGSGKLGSDTNSTSFPDTTGAFAGRMDDVRYYSYALTASEVSALAQ